jgi:hypothetical protein
VDDTGQEPPKLTMTLDDGPPVDASVVLVELIGSHREAVLAAYWKSVARSLMPAPAPEPTPDPADL